jgi:hypothetical protein
MYKWIRTPLTPVIDELPRKTAKKTGAIMKQGSKESIPSNLRNHVPIFHLKQRFCKKAQKKGLILYLSRLFRAGDAGFSTSFLFSATVMVLGSV